MAHLGRGVRGGGGCCGVEHDRRPQQRRDRELAGVRFPEPRRRQRAPRSRSRIANGRIRPGRDELRHVALNPARTFAISRGSGPAGRRYDTAARPGARKDGRRRGRPQARRQGPARRLGGHRPEASSGRSCRTPRRAGRDVHLAGRQSSRASGRQAAEKPRRWSAPQGRGGSTSGLPSTEYWRARWPPVPVPSRGPGRKSSEAGAGASAQREQKSAISARRRLARESPLVLIFAGEAEQYPRRPRMPYADRPVRTREVREGEARPVVRRGSSRTVIGTAMTAPHLQCAFRRADRPITHRTPEASRSKELARHCLAQRTEAQRVLVGHEPGGDKMSEPHRWNMLGLAEES